MGSSRAATPKKPDGPRFDPRCVLCPRLVALRRSCRREHPDYFAAPVPPFGPPRARLTVVGLAPGMHGANRTGRPFTGDFAGILLYATLHKYGFADAAVSTDAADGLRLVGARITNAVKSVPPENKPTPAEVRQCNVFLTRELADLAAGDVVLALGQIAHAAVLRAAGLRPGAARFAHGAEHALPHGATLLDTYHCSRYNQNTRRLTPPMFERVVARARTLMDR